MAAINVGDVIEVVRANPDDPKTLRKVGRVVMVADGTRCIVQFNDGTAGTFEADQLKKVR